MNFVKHEYPYRNVFRIEHQIKTFMKFSKPPSIKNLTDELRNDTIRDKWEWSEDCETNQTLCDIPYDQQPIIGILT